MPLSINRSLVSDSSSNQTAKRLDNPAFSSRAFSRVFTVTVLFAITLIFAPKAHAQSSWTGPGGTTGTPVTGNWNVITNWSPNGVPASSTATNLSFGGSGSTAYTSSNNIGANFTFGTLALNSTASVTEIIDGSSFRIGDGSATQISQANSGAFDIQNNIVNNNAAVLTLTGNGTGLVTLSGTITENNNGSKNLALLKTGSSTYLLTGSNAYTNGTTIQAGTILIGNNNALGTGGTVLLGNTSGSSATNLFTNGAFTLSRAITLQSGNTGLMTLGGNTASASVFSGNILLGSPSAATKGGTFVAASGGSVDFQGVINENTSPTNGQSGAVTIGDGTHSGIVKFSNVANGYGGSTTIGSGATLEVIKLANGGTGSSIGNSGTSAAAGSAATDLVLDNGTLKYTGTGDSTNRLFTIGTGGATIDASASANGALNFTGTGSLVASGTGDRTLTLTGSSTGNNTMTSVIANPSSGTTTLNKTGVGTWVLAGTNLYTGGTNVNGGTLVANVNSLLSVVGTIAVNNSGSILMLSGSGNHIGDNLAITLNGGTFNSNGLSESVGQLTLSSTSIINMALASNNPDLLKFQNSSSKTWSGTLSIYNWSGTLLTGNGTDQLFFGTDATDLTVAQLNSINFYSGNGTGFLGTGIFAPDLDGEIIPTLVPVPEPGTWISGALVVGLIGWSLLKSGKLKRGKAEQSRLVRQTA
jgi:fibronectin-binding autotransporter adhesin